MKELNSLPKTTSIGTKKPPPWILMTDLMIWIIHTPESTPTSTDQDWLAISDLQTLYFQGTLRIVEGAKTARTVIAILS